ncbi:hypothetical protein [Limobrevibacterium gyesilva]|uniref:Uncharacterized protein n=1 Tax=Limobrevibacterium gyesilva TaxID=2991712 RepID=A0AA41YP79_9PROT|nr:hypothetical protein [Limobrevibacterium gyesilva]MCW3475972.1 hypothetical protein [Limobrevibacterium gyesilva]
MATAGNSRLLGGLDALVRAAGAKVWSARLAELGRSAAASQRVGRALLRHHAIEITVDRLRRTGLDRAPTPAEARIIALTAEAASLFATLSAPGKARMRAALRQGLSGENTLVPLYHLLRTAALKRARGFEVRFAGFEDGAPFDLLIRRDGMDAEIACDVVSAEDGRDVHRGAWVRLVDAIDPDLQTWLAAHPGRYLLKLTLPQGLRGEQDRLAALHGRIRTMLAGSRRADHDEAAVLRLDPLMLAAAQADELGLLSSLRREFGHEAHLAVTSAGDGVFVLAARAGRENEVAAAIRRRMAAIAPTRLTGARPGILAMFVEDTDRAEWRHLRDRLELEGEARQFLTNPEARRVVAVTCASRLELFGAGAPDGAPDGEVRFRNPAHPSAKAAALAPAVASSV